MNSWHFRSKSYSGPFVCRKIGVAHLFRNSMYSVCLMRPVLIMIVWKHCRSMAHSLTFVRAGKEEYTRLATWRETVFTLRRADLKKTAGLYALNIRCIRTLCFMHAERGCSEHLICSLEPFMAFILSWHVAFVTELFDQTTQTTAQIESGEICGALSQEGFCLFTLAAAEQTGGILHTVSFSRCYYNTLHGWLSSGHTAAS